MAEKIRVHTLAKALNVSSKNILDKCKAEGISVKNHMSTLGAGLEATVREWFSEGAHATTVEKAERIDLTKVRKKPRAKKAASGTAVKAPAEIKKEKVAAETMTITAEADLQTTSVAAPPIEEIAVTAETITEVPLAPITEYDGQAADDIDIGEAEAPVDVAVEESPVDSSSLAAEAPLVEVTDQPDETIEAEVVGEIPLAPADPIKPAGPQNVPAPAKLSGPRVVRYEAPEEYTVPKRGPRRRAAAPAGQTPGTAPTSQTVTPSEAREVSTTKGRGGKRRPGASDDKGAARRSTFRRSTRGAEEAGEMLSEWNDQDLAERRERLRGATGRRVVSRRAATRKGGSVGPVSTAPITTAQVEEPIMVKKLCAAIGIPFQRVFPVLHKEHNILLSITSIIPKETAELASAAFGVELKVVEAKTGLDKLKEEHEAIEPKNLTRRPPIVTVLGHVDHGKTSLLDHIRRARVADREDGGITQHISSYHFKKGGVAVTFLDTPGHEAFTALRARGAQLTDVVVLVVAADDGIMPQTIEAINHAKAAGVPIVVALNKIDLGTQNINKIYSELSEHGLTPSGDWGGETDVIHTSAISGEGVPSLLEHLTTLADLLEFTADSTVPATGTVVEAESRQGVGPVLQVIVRDGTVAVGDILVCGHSFGKVRAIHDDTGKAVRQVGPAMPAEIWGMNEVAASGDMFYRVDSMQRAKEIAEEVKNRRRSDARSSIRKARSLDDLVKHRTDADVSELNVIVKGDVDGSVDVLAHSLAQFPSDEVKLNILHAGIGVVTDSDVHLADASNAIIVAFRVTTPAKTKKLSEEKGVDIRNYKVIYDVTDDIKKALEGLLAPDEKVESRGAAEVREVFRITKVGLVAGSFVREGTIAANHLARVVRDGVLVRDNCRFNSLRRFKDDVKEVRNGMECGIRLEGFDDVKVGDIIESFEIVKIARTLD